jgi:isopentenyldiphosphate isomerase/intracellular septation protein A
MAMNPMLLLKSLLPGLLPLVVFIAADSIFGETVGLAVGIATGLIEFVYTLIKEKHADPFVAADTILLAVAGGLSLVLQNDLFFKIKPAIIELVMALAMGAMLLLPPSYLKGYIGKTLKGIVIPDEALPSMKKGLGLMLLALAAHIGLTFYAAFALSTAAWGFISGGLLYILFAAVAIFQFASAKLGSRRAASAAGNEEMLPLIDEDGKVLGAAPRSECHKGPGKLHPVVHLQIVDGRGSMYLQKRALDKDIQPGKWDSAVGGHVAVGEDLDAALSREMREELGVTKLALDSSGARVDPILRYRWECPQESEMVFSFIVTYGGPFSPDGKEVIEGKFWSFADIRSNLGKGVFTPNFEHEYGLIEAAAAEAAAAAARASGADSVAVSNTSTGSSAAEQPEAKKGKRFGKKGR